MSRRLTKIISIFICFLLVFQQSGFTQIAGELDLSSHFLGLRNSLIQDKFRAVHLRYLAYDPVLNNFNLLLDKGDQKGTFPKGTPSEQKLKEETKTLLNYFFIGISLPNEAFWVNLRPDSPDNIIDPELAETDVGKILLEADLQLKKDTANFTSPQTPEGKDYWDKLYKKAEEIYGSENITIPTLTRPWIVPDEIIIRESSDNAYIYKATLKVMLEQDYLKDSATYSFQDQRSKALNEYSSQLIREAIIPKLTKEINSSKRYAPLRQAYYSLILAQWFKQKFYGKSGVYSHLIDRHKLDGLTSKTSWSKTTYFNAYKTSFQQGEYNIKEPRSTLYGQTIRSYMSGGIQLGDQDIIRQIIRSARPIKSNSPLFFGNNYIVQGLVKASSAIGDPYHIEAIDISGMTQQRAANPEQRLSGSPLQANTAAASPELSSSENIGIDGSLEVILNENTRWIQKFLGSPNFFRLFEELVKRTNSSRKEYSVTVNKEDTDNPDALVSNIIEGEFTQAKGYEPKPLQLSIHTHPFDSGAFPSQGDMASYKATPESVHMIICNDLLIIISNVAKDFPREEYGLNLKSGTTRSMEILKKHASFKLFEMNRDEAGRIVSISGVKEEQFFGRSMASLSYHLGRLTEQGVSQGAEAGYHDMPVEKLTGHLSDTETKLRNSFKALDKLEMSRDFSLFLVPAFLKAFLLTNGEKEVFIKAAKNILLSQVQVMSAIENKTLEINALFRQWDNIVDALRTKGIQEPPGIRNDILEFRESTRLQSLIGMNDRFGVYCNLTNRIIDEILPLQDAKQRKKDLKKTATELGVRVNWYTIWLSRYISKRIGIFTNEFLDKQAERFANHLPTAIPANEKAEVLIGSAASLEESSVKSAGSPVGVVSVSEGQKETISSVATVHETTRLSADNPASITVALPTCWLVIGFNNKGERAISHGFSDYWYYKDKYRAQYGQEITKDGYISAVITGNNDIFGPDWQLLVVTSQEPVIRQGHPEDYVTAEDVKQYLIRQGVNESAILQNTFPLPKIVSVKNDGIVEIKSFDKNGRTDLAVVRFSPSPSTKNAADGSVSSAVKKDIGGIDMRSLPKYTKVEKVAAGSPLVKQGQSPSGTAPVSDKEWQEIERMANSGIAPSCERIREYLLSLQDPGAQADKVLACIADILRQEEEKACGTEASLREILVLLESGKPVNELRLALINIQVLAKEPQLITQ